MPKNAPYSQLNDIVRAVEWFPLGVAVSTLLERPEITMPKRTLQRRLDQLVKEGRLAAIGRARARRYTALASVAAEEHVLREEPALTHSYWRSRHHSRVARDGFAAIVAAIRHLAHEGGLPA